jgi:hypothetical protein
METNNKRYTLTGKSSGSFLRIFLQRKHPLSEELFGDDIRPSEFNSIKEMVNAVCEERLPRFTEAEINRSLIFGITTCR